MPKKVGKIGTFSIKGCQQNMQAAVVLAQEDVPQAHKHEWNIRC